MKTERLILIPFFGNYIINNVVAAIAALFPASTTGSVLTLQYIVFVVIALLVSAWFAWWYFRGTSNSMMVKAGAIFGVAGFLVSVATTFVSGFAGVILQTGSIAQAFTVLPKFGPFLWNWSTLVVLGYWLIPAIIVAYWLQSKVVKSSSMM